MVFHDLFVQQKRGNSYRSLRPMPILQPHSVRHFIYMIFISHGPLICDGMSLLNVSALHRTQKLLVHVHDISGSKY